MWIQKFGIYEDDCDASVDDKVEIFPCIKDDVYKVFSDSSPIYDTYWDTDDLFNDLDKLSDANK